MCNDGGAFWNYCSHCGAKLGLEDWPPVVEMRSDGDETTIHSFCAENCKTAWRNDE